MTYDWFCDDEAEHGGYLEDFEIEALQHAQRRVEQDGAHSLTGCPRNCRAMCSYGRVLEDLESRGVRVPS